VSLPLPPHVVTALDAVPKLGGEYLFWSGEGDAKSCVADWQRSFRKLCTLAGVQNGHFHRFRDTAAVGWLAAGLSIEEVAALLGNSPNVVIKHYSPWVLERQRVLEAKVQASWGKPPKPRHHLRLVGTNRPPAA
jgi:integrase